MKQYKAIAFDPAVYDYMDRMPLEGWFWEIIRRSNEYKAYYAELEKAFTGDSKKTNWGKYNQRLLNDYRSGMIGKTFLALDFWGKKIFENKILWPGVDVNLIEKKVQENFLILSKDKKVGYILPKPRTKYKDFDKYNRPKIIGVYPVKVHPGAGYELMKKEHGEQSAKDTIFRILTFEEPQLTIYVGISLTAKLQDIMTGLEPHLKTLLVRKTARIRAFDKWKYYLITFDLKQIDISYDDIANTLSEYYEASGGQEVFDNRTVENYYKSALALINGGYKKYLYK